MAQRARGPVKITDVAAAAGVAPMTVSRVLNTPERVSQETAARVREAIEQLGYVPNLIAGGLSSRRSRMIAAVVPTIASPMFADPIRSFTEVMAGAGYEVMLSISGYENEDEEAQIRSILGRRPDALLLTGAHHGEATRRLIADAAVPVVEIWDTAEEPFDMLVGLDHEQVGAAVAAFFLARGHRRFAVIGASDQRGRARRHGFMKTIEAHGGTIIAAPLLPAPSSMLDGRAALRALLPLPRGRVAVLASSDLVAFGVITEALAQGIAVPGRLAVCGFGDFEISRAAEPPFTTVSVDGSRVGALAAEMLLQRLSGRAPRGTPRSIHVPFRIIERAST